MRSRQGRPSLITAWFLVRGQVCAKTRVTTLHTRSMERVHNFSASPPGSLDPALLPLAIATSITICCAKRTIQSFVAHVQPLEKGTRFVRSPNQPPRFRASHKICEILCKMYNTHIHTHTRRGLFRWVQLSATTFVFARRGGAFTVCVCMCVRIAHAAVVPASSFP